jgi:NAD(P)-dependent dehydrogenase (short-subunit alcohol dehydrogenase family)
MTRSFIEAASILTRNQGQTTFSSMDEFWLDGKVAVITGGAKGIGAATIALFKKYGARTFSLDITDGCDVTDEAAVKAAFARIEEIDILVNNAGRAARKPAVELSLEEWNQVIELNLTATFLCSRLAHPYMKKRGGGAIVNLASIMGFSGGIFPNASYQASKGGVVNLTRALALEWAADNIRVNAVAPTYVRTDLTVPIFGNPEMLEKVMQHTPLRRFPEVEEIAAAILYLCSPAARCITGITLPVDSGYLAR